MRRAFMPERGLNLQTIASIDASIPMVSVRPGHQPLRNARTRRNSGVDVLSYRRASIRRPPASHGGDDLPGAHEVMRKCRVFEPNAVTRTGTRVRSGGVEHDRHQMRSDIFMNSKRTD